MTFSYANAQANNGGSGFEPFRQSLRLPATILLAYARFWALTGMLVSALRDAPAVARLQELNLLSGESLLILFCRRSDLRL